jgi:SAM-dependent methyltransferase
VKKDFVIVGADEASRDELMAIEQQWTRHWADVAAQPRRDTVMASDEYRRLRAFLDPLPRGSRILDGGCGPGAWTVVLSDGGFRVVGLDVSRPTLAALHRVRPDLPLVCGDIRDTPFADATFDAYFSWGTFEHFEEGLQGCVREARRLLKPRGLLFVTVPFDNARHRWQARRSARDGRTGEGGDGQARRFYQWRLTRRELARELAPGFEIVRIEAIHKWHGLHRALHHDLGIASGSWLHARLVDLLRPIVPAAYVAHMLLGIGRRV